jgi:AraC-like DNA-binding protein
MPVLPVPMVISIVLFAFLANRWAKGETHGSLLALIAICAVQAALIALVQFYGASALRPVQPILAMVIPPVAWLAFARASGGSVSLRSMAMHALGPMVALLSLAALPALLDVLIPLSFTAYGAAMLVRLAGGEASLPNSRLEHGAGSLMAWRVVALALIASALCDVLIVYGQMTGGAAWTLWMPSLVSSLSLLALGALSLNPAMESRGEAADDASPSPEDAERDAALMAKLDAYVAAHKPHLDPDLTLTRLARKLGVPAKQLSSAINRSRGENVSRAINRLRIGEACSRLANGSSVTAAMLDSGFNTKSNFNREFARVTGMSPSQWIAKQINASLQ